MPTAPPTVTPIRDDNGLVNIPESMLLMGRQGVRRLISSRALLRKGLAGLERAAHRGEVFHLWFHPSNFSSQTDDQFEVLGQLLQRAQALQTSGRLTILPMRGHV